MRSCLLSALALALPLLSTFAPTAFGFLSSPADRLVARDGNADVALDSASSFVTSFGGIAKNFTFSLTVDLNGDLYFRLAGPAWWSWLAVGTGTEMKGSLMFLVYKNAGNNVTLSARMGTGEFEPSYNKSISLNLISPPPGDPPNGYYNNMLYATAKCQGCSSIAPSKINPHSTSQPFIYAVGAAGRNPNSNSASAGLRRHQHYGRFTMDMTAAAGRGAPSLGLVSSIGTKNLGDHTDRDFAETGHVFAMLVAWVIIFPLGFFFVRVLERVRLHLVFQTVGAALVVIGMVCGIFIAGYYNRTKPFKSAHQILGVIIVVGLLTQWTLGLLHHRQFKRTRQPLKWAIRPHKYGLGAVLWSLALVNASLGFYLAMAPQRNTVLWPFIFFIALALFAASWFKPWFARRFGAAPRARPVIGPPLSAAGAQQQDFGIGPTAPLPPPGSGGGRGVYAHDYAARSDIALGDVPGYSVQPTKPREFA